MVMAEKQSLSEIVDRIYESIERPDLWPQTIYAIGDFLGGRPHFWGADQSTERAGPPPNMSILEAGCQPTLFLSRMDLKALDEYEREFGELIIRFLKNVFLSILWSPDDVRARETIGLIMTQRYVQAFEPSVGTSTSSPAISARRKLIAALWEDGHVFSSDNLHSMRLLAPHLDRAVRLQMRLNSADLHADRISGALDALTLGVVLVDGSGLPLWHNRRAQEIMSRSNAVRLASAGLAGHRRSDTQSLRELIKQAVSAGNQGLLAISRGAELRPLLVVAVPLKPRGVPDDSDRSTCGVIFISDPDRTDAPTVKALRQAFDLTYREAQTAIAIANGQGLKAAARSMGVALTTARSQLQQAFAKTGTSHQAELAALVHKTFTHLRSDPDVQPKRPG
jgi:DNA-binding CsgD family transcriptional regulator/PAS domain-containing protein